MTDGAQSPNRDGTAPMLPGRKAGHPVDLRRKLKLATWNVMTLSDTGYQTALVRELTRLNVSIAGITEARLPGNDCCRVDSALILHSGGDQHRNGVAMVVRSPLDRSLVSWKPISDRLLLARFKHRHGHLSVVVAYAPTEPTESDLKEAFYNQLSAITQAVPPHDILVVLGDFNAVSGTSDRGSGVVGPFGSGVPNENSDLLLTYCGLQGLTVVGSWFRRLDIHRHTWISHDGVTKKEIDHILTRRRDKALFKSCRAYRGAEAPANTDHVLLASELCITLHKTKKQPSHKPFDVARLTQDTDLQWQYNVAVQNKFGSLSSTPEDVDASWNFFRAAITSAANEVVGTRNQARKPWLSHETFAVLERKAAAKNRNDHAERKRLQSIFRAKAKADHEAYLNRLADEAEQGMRSNCLGPVFRAIKQLAGPKASQTSPTINKVDGSPCSSREETLSRWQEHFEAALNHLPGTSSPVLDSEATNTSTDPDTSTDEPSLDEVTRAISKLRNGRAAGPDGIPSELLKCAIGPVSRALHSLFCQVWRTGLIPSDWRDGILVALYKGKGTKSECSNYRPITLLSVPGKVFAHVLLARLQPLLDATRRPQQSGFVAGRSTIDAILALRLLSELHREFDQPLNVAYLDIKAAFDSVDRKALWKALRGRGIPDILLDLIISLHENTGVQVRHGHDLSQRIQTSSGVRQGCVLAPALFCIAIDWILRHMTAKPAIEVGRDHLSDLVYADDTAFLLKSTTDATTSLSSFSETASVFGLRISWPKTKLQNLGSGAQPPSISVDGNLVESVNNFIYLGSVQSSDGYCRPDINRRIGLASSVMASLSNTWNNRHLSISSKIRVYQALVTSVLLYAAESWTMLASDMKTLEAFHMKCQRQILKVKWHQFVRNEEITAITGLPPMCEIISCRRNAVFGHIARLNEDVPAHQALHAHVNLSLGRPPDSSWKRRPGRPRCRWIDQLRKDNDVPPADLWRRAVRRGHGASLRPRLATC